MKLVYIAASFPFTKGGEAFFTPEVRHLERLGHEVLLAPRSRGKKLESGANVLVAKVVPGGILSPGAIWSSLQELVRDPRMVIRVAWKVFGQGSLLNRVKNVLVFPRAVFVGVLARQMRADHIHAQWASTTATIGLVAHEVSGIPWSFTAHRGDIVLSNLFEAKAQSASFIRFISESGVALSVQRHSPVDGSRQCVIHLGIDVPLLCEVPQPRKRGRNVLCAANLLPVKGHRHLIEAIGLLRDRGVACQLTLAGDGYLRAELKRVVAGLELGERVTFLGHVPHAELLARYRRGEVDVFVLPSVDLGGGNHEGIPVSLMEAMAHRIPVIATSTGGIPELLLNGAGLMVPPADPSALAEAIARLLGNDDECRRYAEAGRRRVEEDFNVTTTTRALVCEMQRSPERAQMR